MTARQFGWSLAETVLGRAPPPSGIQGAILPAEDVGRRDLRPSIQGTGLGQDSLRVHQPAGCKRPTGHVRRAVVKKELHRHGIVFRGVFAHPIRAKHLRSSLVLLQEALADFWDHRSQKDHPRDGSVARNKRQKQSARGMRDDHSVLAVLERLTNYLGISRGTGGGFVIRKLDAAYLVTSALQFRNEQFPA